MGKKKGALFLFVLTGVIALCGSAGLYHNMEKARQKETSIQIERKEDVVFEEDSQKADGQEVDMQQGIPAKVFRKKEAITLPEGAKIVSKMEDTYKIEWNQCSIEYWQDESLALEKVEDLGLQNLLPLLKNVIKQYSGQTMGNCEMSLFMTEPEPGDTKCYDVRVFMDKYTYRMEVDSVTGEVLYYHYENMNWDEFLGEWDVENAYSGIVEYELPQAVKKEYDPVIVSFVTDVLNYGNVEKIYGQHGGFQYYDVPGDGECFRACYSASCKTDTGSMIEVSIDVEEKIVTYFSVEMRYTVEE